MSETQRRTLRQRLTLTAIVAIFVAPLLGAWLLYTFTDYGRGSRPASYGQLLQPARPLPDVALYNPLGGETLQGLHGKWTLIALSGPDCEQRCLDDLDRMRQVRLAMEEHLHRVQRLLVVYGADPARFSAPLRDGNKGQLYLDGALLDASDPGASFRQAPDEDPVGAGRLYLVDPLGNIMMSYAADALPGGIIKDLRRLLRYSRIG